MKRENSKEGGAVKQGGGRKMQGHRMVRKA